jgi:hypothetical protein
MMRSTTGPRVTLGNPRLTEDYDWWITDEERAILRSHCNNTSFDTMVRSRVYDYYDFTTQWEITNENAEQLGFGSARQTTTHPIWPVVSGGTYLGRWSPCAGEEERDLYFLPYTESRPHSTLVVRCRSGERKLVASGYLFRLADQPGFEEDFKEIRARAIMQGIEVFPFREQTAPQP